MNEFFKLASQYLAYRQQMVTKIGPDGLPFHPELNQIGQLDTHMEMKLLLEFLKKGKG